MTNYTETSIAMSTQTLFAERLKSARETKKLSQAELAKSAGLQPSHVSHFETGRRAPSSANLRALADALGVTTDFLLGRQSCQGMAGPRLDQVVAYAERLSDSDLDVLAAFAETLAERRKASDRKNR
ncbi:MAG: helix-turn-helix domain-containing protein [Candidatus Xenobia bacterium]